MEAQVVACGSVFEISVIGNAGRMIYRIEKYGHGPLGFNKGRVVLALKF